MSIDVRILIHVYMVLKTGSYTTVAVGSTHHTGTSVSEPNVSKCAIHLMYLFNKYFYFDRFAVKSLFMEEQGR